MTPEYIAGFFDGEGCIDTQKLYPKQGKVGTTYLACRIRITQTKMFAGILSTLQTEYGGSLSNRVEKTGRGNDSVEWTVTGRVRVTSFLSAISPHLVLKKPQAELVLWWLGNGSGKYSKRDADVSAVSEARGIFAEELKLMKRDVNRTSENAIARLAETLKGT